MSKAEINRATPGVWTNVSAHVSRTTTGRPAASASMAASPNPSLTDGNANTLLATTLGTTNGEAARLVQVGDATAPRMQFSGEAAPAKHPHVAAGVATGDLSSAAAAAIVAALDRVEPRAGRSAADDAERVLVEQAPGLSLDQLSKILARAEAHLDPDGVAPREDDLRAGRVLRMREDRDGMLHLHGTLDPEAAAPVRAAIEGYVTAELAAQRDRGHTAGDASTGTAKPADLPLDDLPDAPRRTIPRLQADALVALCEHLLGCDRRDVPLQGATVVVRVSLDDLLDGTGHASIDGTTAPVSISTARRMAADKGIIPCVLGGDSEILDWGRQKRLFTPAQRLALIERDGGCAFCGAPPGHAKVHHIQWWARDRGRTDLSNGILLCTSCHHRIHDNGWDIRIDGPGTNARVWFIPPPWVDSTRTPRLGARHRYDYAPAAA